MLRYCVSIFLSLYCAGVLAETHFASDEKLKRLQSLVKDQMTSQQVPGLSLVVIESGQIVYLGAFGRASTSNQGQIVPMRVDTPSALGSLSKSFTAVAVMQLVQEGALQLDDVVSTYLEELSAPIDKRMLKVTVRQLLNHTSGLSTYNGNFGQANYAAREDALEVAAQRLAGSSLERDPGVDFEYSNANYQLLGLLLERLDQRAFEEVIQTRVLDPLKLSNSYVREPVRPDQRGASGHRYWLHKPVAFAKTLPRTVVAQGGVYASATDVATYLLDLMSEQPVLLSPKLRDQLFKLDNKGATKGYGLGWFVEPHRSGELIFHGGTNPGYEVEAGFLPTLKSGYVVLTNANSGFAGGDVGSVIRSIKELLLDGEVTSRSSFWVNRILLAAFVLLALNLLFLCLLWLKRLIYWTFEEMQRRFGTPRWALQLVLPVVLLLGLALLLLWYIPKISTIPLVGLHAFAPDIGSVLMAAGVLSVLLSVLRTLAWVRYRTQYRGELSH